MEPLTIGPKGFNFVNDITTTILFGGEIRTGENEWMLSGFFLLAQSEKLHKLEVVFENEQVVKTEWQKLHNVKFVFENVQGEKKTTT